MTKHHLGGDETESRDPEIRGKFEKQTVSPPPSGLCEILAPLGSHEGWLINRKVFCLPCTPDLYHSLTGSFPDQHLLGTWLHCSLS